MGLGSEWDGSRVGIGWEKYGDRNWDGRRVGMGVGWRWD